MEEVQKMISRSLYIARTDDPISVLSDGLCISESNRFHHDACGIDYSFFKRGENSLFFAPVEGSFQFASDVNLFGLDWPTLESKLLALSEKGLLIAIPDEDSDMPFDFLLYENGTRTPIQVIENEETGQLSIRARRA